MICASKLSLVLGKIGDEEYKRIKKIVKSAGLPTELPTNFDYDDFKEAMSRDAAPSDKLRFITLNSIGRAQFRKILTKIHHESLKI